MVFTKNQIENMTREKLIEGLLKFSNISNQLKSLNDNFDSSTVKYENMESKVSLTKNHDTCLHHDIIQLERNAVNNAQYHRGESLKVNRDNGHIVLEETVLRTLIQHETTLDDLLLLLLLLLNKGIL